MEHIRGQQPTNPSLPSTAVVILKSACSRIVLRKMDRVSPSGSANLDPGSGVTLISVETGERRELAKQDGEMSQSAFGCFSPHGRRLAFLKMRGAYGRLYVADLTADMRLAGKPREIIPGAASPIPGVDNGRARDSLHARIRQQHDPATNGQSWPFTSLRGVLLQCCPLHRCYAFLPSTPYGTKMGQMSNRSSNCHGLPVLGSFRNFPQREAVGSFRNSLASESDLALHPCQTNQPDPQEARRHRLRRGTLCRIEADKIAAIGCHLVRIDACLGRAGEVSVVAHSRAAGQRERDRARNGIVRSPIHQAPRQQGFRPDRSRSNDCPRRH